MGTLFVGGDGGFAVRGAIYVLCNARISTRATNIFFLEFNLYTMTSYFLEVRTRFRRFFPIGAFSHFTRLVVPFYNAKGSFNGVDDVDDGFNDGGSLFCVDYV